MVELCAWTAGWSSGSSAWVVTVTLTLSAAGGRAGLWSGRQVGRLAGGRAVCVVVVKRLLVVGLFGRLVGGLRSHLLGRLACR